jgi:hypothetical protein
MAARKAFRYSNLNKEIPGKSKIVIRPHPNAELRSRKKIQVKGIPAQVTEFLAQVNLTLNTKSPIFQSEIMDLGSSDEEIHDEFFVC